MVSNTYNFRRGRPMGEAWWAQFKASLDYMVDMRQDVATE